MKKTTTAFWWILSKWQFILPIVVRRLPGRGRWRDILEEGSTCFGNLEFPELVGLSNREELVLL